MSVEKVADYFHLYTLDHPEVPLDPVPAEPYYKPEYFEKEREKIFRKFWSLVGRADDIPNPGDYFVKDIPPLETSIIVVRGDDRTVRAFFNACPHRGNALARDCGNARAFSCGFHGWVFDRAGKHVSIPEPDLYFNLEKYDTNLAALGCEVWKGFIFVNPDRQTRHGLRDNLGPLAKQLDPYPFENMVRIAKWSADVKTNWKIFMDAFQESFHVPYIHNSILAAAFTGEANPGCRAAGFRFYGRNRAHSPRRNRHYVPSPTQAATYKYAVSISGTSELTGEQTGGLRGNGLNPAGDPDVGFDVNIIFPNTFIDVSDGWYFTYEFWPVAVDQTHWEVNFYANDAKDCGTRLAQEMGLIEFRDGLREDLSTLEAVQRGLKSRAIKWLHFSDQELLCRHQFLMVDSVVSGPDS